MWVEVGEGSQMGSQLVVQETPLGAAAKTNRKTFVFLKRFLPDVGCIGARRG